ncbi:DUF2917 domain-containing protein [Undibacterium sp. CY18W]|uniref:DUF2917 domain-containing protein n=1 Tax=Undibacterium hunanense TaxID=2762292 RepID=A0ABR6ZXK8_9BURK|nr:DUF2917 domain-containing protein [Undibacterium hunanense]MBC3920514.1 DUF2917 domain-containing protein [Undibacterium hunanense]
MTNNFANPSYTIAAGNTLSGHSETARKIEVACGRVWLTIAGNQDDFWLAAGESMVIPANQLVVIEAEQQASLIELSAVSSVISMKNQDFLAGGYLQKLTRKLSQVFA